MIREFLESLSEFDFVSGYINVRHGDLDQSKQFATLWFNQGENLRPKAKIVLKNGLQKYPIIFHKEAPALIDEKYEFTDYVGTFSFSRTNEGPTEWMLSLQEEDSATLTKFVDKETHDGESTITFWIQWIDSERIVYQAGLVQAKEVEGEDFYENYESNLLP